MTFGVLVALCIWIVQRRSLGAWPKAVMACSIFAVAIIILLFPWEVETLGEGTWYRESPWRELVFFVYMLLGMLCRYVTRAIEERRERLVRLRDSGSTCESLRLEFDVWEFSYPLFMSVVTFGGLLTQIGDGVPSLATMVLSFLTGFFWQTTLATKTN